MNRSLSGSVASLILPAACALAIYTANASAATNYTVVGWNNLGMHCMDADYSVFSILPPYNVINAQVIDPSGTLVTADISLTYQAIPDPTGSINTTSAGKTEFWQYLPSLFGLSLPVDVGLPVPGPNSFAMPGTNNIPQSMELETNLNWFSAYGIPLTPYDDTFAQNPYPMMRLTAKLAGTTVGTLDIVLPVSDEMDCRACHASGSGPAAQPAAGWVNDPNPQRDYRLNILRLHDERQGTGLFTNTPVLCASCHLSEALPGSGQPGIPALTRSMHDFHAHVTDPTNGLTLDSSDNRSACYRCHPGSETRCLRGAMGNAVAPNGQLAMQCQSCHGSMSVVGASNRTGWLNEPTCQSCHTGDAVSNSGQIRYTNSFTNGVPRVPANQRFATTPDAPAAGLSLYRFSTGHGGLYCEACHGSTHAEFPSSHINDNVQSTQNQGHVGVFVECDKCHGTQPNTVTGGPHGLHPVGQTWVSRHSDIVESQGAAQCRVCHGVDYRGTVLSRSQADRVISAFGTKNFWRGFQIGCYTCHNGPGSENSNPNHPPVVTSTSVSTATNTPVAIALQAADADKNALTLRVVTQTTHGTVGLIGTVATYFPDTGYVGGDTFTFAATDGQTDSNLGTVQITVGGSGCAYTISPLNATYTAIAATGTINVTAPGGCAWTATSHSSWLTITTTTANTVTYSVASNNGTSSRMGTMTVAGQTFTVTQDGAVIDLTGQWNDLFQNCKTGATTKCTLKGHITVRNTSPATAPQSVLAVFLSSDATLDASDTLLKQYKIKKLTAAKPFTKSVKLTIPAGASASGKYVIALIDADDSIPDADDTNNTVAFGPIP